MKLRTSAKMYRIDTDFVALSIGIWTLARLEDFMWVLSMRSLGRVELREDVLDSGVKKFGQNTKMFKKTLVLTF